MARACAARRTEESLAASSSDPGCPIRLGCIRVSDCRSPARNGGRLGLTAATRSSARSPKRAAARGHYRSRRTRGDDVGLNSTAESIAVAPRATSVRAAANRVMQSFLVGAGRDIQITPRSCMRTGFLQPGAGAARCSYFVRLSSEHASQAVRYDCSFAKKRGPPAGAPGPRPEQLSRCGGDRPQIRPTGPLRAQPVAT
jgi:hypothetical protein